MKVRTLRLLDRYVGVPVCGLLTLARVLTSRSRGPRTAPLLRRILFIKLLEQGTTVLAGPALSAAAARVGRENVYFLVFGQNREVLDLMGMVPTENVICVPSASVWSALRGLAEAIRKMHRLEIDAVVDLEFFSRATAAISFLSGASTRSGLHPGPGTGPWRGDLLTHRVLYQPDLHTSQLYEVLVRALDCPGDSLPTLPFLEPRVMENGPLFQPGPEEIARVSRMLGAPLPETPSPRLFLLNANAGDLEPLRRWPAERYVDLARSLLRDHPDARVVFTGSAAEAAETNALAGRVGSPRCVSLAGTTTLRDLLTLCALCDVLVTNDSGPGHFMSLTLGRAIVLFGPESPKRFGPQSPRSRAIFTGLACSPCLSAHNNRRSSCTNNLCMQRISAEEVLGAVREILSLPSP